MTCVLCGSPNADVDLGVCYECFVEGNPPKPKPTDEEMCASYGHEPYEAGADRCYCGFRTFDRVRSREG